MEGLVTADNNGGCQGFLQDQTQDFPADVGETESFTDSVEDECRNSSSSSNATASEATTNEERITRNTTTAAATSNSSKELNPLGWPIRKSEFSNRPSSDSFENEAADKLFHPEIKKLSCKISDVEIMKERFSKLLLGEDMSGSGKGVCSALALSNAITNLCATLFGQLWRLEPLPPEKKSMWKREMECLLCVADHIVELIPSWQTFPDGSKLEVMTCRPRSDLSINLPALRKLDNMLLEILDSFDSTEFWYVEQGIAAPDAGNGSATFAKPLKRQAEKWWLPSPCVPPQGLDEDSRKHLQHKRECANQILKAAMAINSVALAEMEIPESYLNALPKNGRASLGDLMHRYITSDHFSPECLLDCLDMSSEHQALEMANRVEASIYVWRRRTNGKPPNIPNRATSKSSWGLVKDLMVDTADKRELLANRAESLLLCLKQRFPGLPQTALDTSKIQFNKDVGKSILESYSRVLESLAYNIVARIDDLLHVDVSTKHLDQNSSISTSRAISQKRVVIPYSVPVPSTPYKTAVATPSFSPAPLVSPSPARKERSPFLNKSKLPPQHRGFGVKKVLVEYLGVDAKEKRSGNRIDISDPLSSMGQESPEALDEVKHMVKNHRNLWMK